MFVHWMGTDAFSFSGFQWSVLEWLRNPTFDCPRTVAIGYGPRCLHETLGSGDHVASCQAGEQGGGSQWLSQAVVECSYFCGGLFGQVSYISGGAVVVQLASIV